MRVDPNPASQPLLESERNSNTRAPSGESQPAASHAAGSVLGEDQADLSSASAQVQALVSQASQLPDTRQETVNALRQAILGGSYQSGPTQISEALFAHMLVTPGT